MKNNKSRIIIVLVTAGLTFGTLVAVKGESYKHRFNNHHHNKHQCDQDTKIQSNENMDIEKQQVE